MAGVAKNMIVRVGADFSGMFGELDKAKKKSKRDFEEIGKSASSAKGLKEAFSGAGGNVSAELDAVRQRSAQLTAYLDATGKKLDELRYSGQGESDFAKQLQADFENADKLIDAYSQREAVLKFRADFSEAYAAADRAAPSEETLSKWGMLKQTIKNALSSEEFAAFKANAAELGRAFVTVVSVPVKIAAASIRGLHTAASAVASGFRAIGTVARPVFSGVRAALSPITGAISSMAGGIKRVISQYLGFGLVTATMGRLKSIVSETISQNAGLKAQADSLRASMATALAPAINLVTNAMSALMPYIVGVSNAIGSLISNLFGSGWTAAADGANATAAATGAAAKAQEEYNRQLMGFDEINKLSAPSDSTSGGGGGGGASSTTKPVEGKMPAWITSIAQSIRDSIANDDWSIVGREIGTQLEGVFSKAHEWMNKIDFSGIGRGFAQGINGAVETFLQPGSIGIGTIISDALNAEIRAFAGFTTSIDWGNLGRLIVKEVGDFVSNIDWSSLAVGTGALAAGIITAVGQPIVDGIRGIADYFSNEIDEAGGNIWAGIKNGVVKAVSAAGNWFVDNMFRPFINGFKAAFGIHSPASAPELLEAAGYVGSGILNGIAAPFVAIGTWVKEHILTPLKNAISGGDKPKVEVDISNNTSSLWTKVKGWWGTKNLSTGTSASNTTSSMWTKVKGWWGTKNLATGTSASNTTSSMWTKVKGWWGSKNLSVATSLSTTSSTVSKWWSRTKDWWAKAKGSKKLDSVSADMKNTASTWWSNASTWWKTAKGTLETVKVNAAKGAGWSNMSSWLGGLQKYIGLSVTWQNPSGWIEETISKYIFNSYGLPKLSFAAEGGIVNRTTLFGGNIVAGEAGIEAIVPLKRNTEWADIVANQIAGILQGSNSQQPININLMLDGKIVGRAAVNYINGQAVQTGVNPLIAYI